MNRRRTGSGNPPWPMAAKCLDRAGPCLQIAVAPPRHELAANDPRESERIAGLMEARASLVAALALLDLHARSPAAANVDLAIHQIDAELAR
jgi:hypothetical protein